MGQDAWHIKLVDEGRKNGIQPYISDDHSWISNNN